MRNLNSILNEIIGLFYPKCCICCGEIIKEQESLCDLCYKNIEKFDSRKICLKCGLERKKCDCNKYVYRFEACVAPFKNTGIAQTGFYRYKFLKRVHYARYFAEQMSLCVLNEYRNIKFDRICFVPATIESKLKRGFNQSEVLAKEISKILNIPIYKNPLVKKRKTKTQHTLSSKERFSNIKGSYGFNSRLDGKTILLVDDIKTTGATLNECSKQLLLAGAEKVFCVSALISAKTVEKK